MDLLISDDINVLIKQKDLNTEIEPEIILNDNISAPIAQGTVLGQIKYNIEGIEYKSDITASHPVEKDNFIFLILQLLLIATIIYILYKYRTSNNKRKFKFKHKRAKFN